MRISNGIEKMKASEAYYLVVHDKRMLWEDHSQVIRQCSYCEAWVDVDDQSGEAQILVDEREMEFKVCYDICDDCQERIKQGQELDDYDYEDVDLEEYCHDCGEAIEYDEDGDEYCRCS